MPYVSWLTSFSLSCMRRSSPTDCPHWRWRACFLAYLFFFLSNLPFLCASFRATRPAVNFRSKKQSLPVFACENVVRRGSPDTLPLCASSCRLWTSDLKDPLQEDPLPFFPLRFCFAPPRCQARDILLCGTLWCGCMFWLLFFPIVCCKMPCFPTNPLCLDLLFVTPLCVPVLECLNFFRESAFLYMEEVVQGFFCLTLVFALSKSSARGTLEDAASCWACMSPGVAVAQIASFTGQGLFSYAFSWVDAFLSFV